MSLINSNETVGATGVKKTIDEKSMGIALDVLQCSMYQYGIKSTVREVSSNAVDAVKEKQMARNIINGNNIVSDYFIEEEGDIYHSSKFDDSYYDLNFLSDDDQVYLKYEEKGPGEKDCFSVQDHGVGLGGDRLESFFTLNYSTKRLTKNLLGSFGLGSKSPLSTGVESFRMESIYNGEKFAFDIYVDKIESVIPKFNDKGLNNVHHFKEQDYEFYAEPTNEKNGVKIIVETKKHHRRDYVHAVKSQLLYFKGLKFIYRYENDNSDSEIDLGAKIIYEDMDILISNNSEYDKPHIILGTDDTQVVYGAVDFQELELEQRMGAIGLKMNLADIAVTPSRESVIWNIKTREAVIAKFNTVQETAAKVIQDSLSKETDFLTWVRKINKILNTNSTTYDYRYGHSVIDPETDSIGILSQIIDRTKIIIKFNSDKSIRYVQDVKRFFGDSASIRTVSIDRYSGKVQRKDSNSWNTFDLPIYIQRESVVSFSKDSYLCKQIEKGDFLLIKVNDEAKNKAGIKGLDSILKSSTIKEYDDVIVPEGMEIDEDSNKVVNLLSPAERRKLNNQIVFFSVTKDYANNYKLVKEEQTVKQLESYKCTIVYGNKKDVDLIKLIQTCLDGAGVTTNIYDVDYVLPVQVSKSNVKHFKDLENSMEVNEFLFGNVINGVYVLPKTICSYLYLKSIKSQLDIDLKFLGNFSCIDKDASDKYLALRKSLDKNYKSYEISDTIQMYEEHFKKCLDVQIKMDKYKDVDIVKELDFDSCKVVDKDKITAVSVINLGDVYNSIEDLKMYAKPIKVLLNSIKPLVSNNSDVKIDSDLIDDIRAFIEIKTA